MEWKGKFLRRTFQHMVANPQPDDTHGIPMTEEAFGRLVSGENPYRYELINGTVYDMTGSTPEHADIVGNTFSLIHAHIRQHGPCKVYQDQYVAIPGRPPVVPDVVVTCNQEDWDKNRRPRPFKIRSPRIVIEVLSPSTERYDREEKFVRYRSCASLEVYILVSQDEPYIEVYRRETGWKQERFSGGQIIRLGQIDLELPVDSIYEGIW
jgi:Uma2 family endonuclease